jgi:2,5-diketo-D-gluconate reductase B
MDEDDSQLYVEVGDAMIPNLGLGTWQNTGESCTRAVETALEVGYRHIDTAQVYGNEEQVGEGIARADVPREDIFLTTKVWRSNLGYDDVLESTRESLNKLGVDYVDLLLIHWPHPRVSVSETLEAMATLQDDGLVSHIGVSNFTASQLQNAIDVAESPVIADQVLYNPLKDQSAVRNVCLDHDIALTAYSPLARGGVLDDDVLEEIADAHGKSAAQVSLRWLLQQENVVAIPKATSRDHIEANFEVFDFSLADEEMQRIHDRKPGLKQRLLNRLPGLMRRNPL